MIRALYAIAANLGRIAYEMEMDRKRQERSDRVTEAWLKEAYGDTAGR